MLFFLAIGLYLTFIGVEHHLIDGNLAFAGWGVITLAMILKLDWSD